MQFSKCNSHILHEQLQQSERFTGANLISCHHVTVKYMYLQKQWSNWENRAALDISYVCNVWHSPAGTPLAICTIIFLVISQNCVFMYRANRCLCRKEESKPLHLGQPDALRFDKCCKALLSKFLEIKSGPGL